MTQQEIYNRVRDHLLAQNATSEGGIGCMYRGEGGLMCAVGCLIPDEAYDLEMEGKNVETLLEDHMGSLPQDVFNRENEDLLLELQAVHDDGPVASWPSLLADVATQNGLVP